MISNKGKDEIGNEKLINLAPLNTLYWRLGAELVL
jgi:hypothetical protein